MQFVRAAGVLVNLLVVRGLLVILAAYSTARVKSQSTRCRVNVPPTIIL